jgi:hypothetical protein
MTGTIAITHYGWYEFLHMVGLLVEQGTRLTGDSNRGNGRMCSPQGVGSSFWLGKAEYA